MDRPKDKTLFYKNCETKSSKGLMMFIKRFISLK